MEEKFELKPSEEFMYDLYSNHAMNALVIRQSHTLFSHDVMAVIAFDMTEAMILERRKRKDEYKLRD